MQRRSSVSRAESAASALEALRANRPLRAEEICRDFLVLNPGCRDHLRLLGHALMKQFRLPEAEEQIRFALSLDPDFPQLHEDLGSVLALQERYEEAIPSFEKAISLEPRLPIVHKKLGQALAALGRGQRVFFLTAKTLQQRIAVETAKAMQDGLFRSLQLRAKSKMCANTEIVCHEEFCPYAKEYGLKLARTDPHDSGGRWRA